MVLLALKNNPSISIINLETSQTGNCKVLQASSACRRIMWDVEKRDNLQNRRYSDYKLISGFRDRSRAIYVRCIKVFVLTKREEGL